MKWFARKKPKKYEFALTAAYYCQDRMHISVSLCEIKAGSQDEAESLAKQTCDKRYPLSAGWTQRRVEVGSPGNASTSGEIEPAKVPE